MRIFSISLTGSLLIALAAGGAVLLAPSPLVAPAQAAPKVAASLLITSKSIGPARLGRSVAALKKAFPGSVIVEEEGPVGFYNLKKNGRDLLHFNTRRAMSTKYDGKMRDADIVTALWTSEPNFKTSKGIGPGSWLHNAVAVYGTPRLSFSPHDETGIFPAYSNKLWFEPEAPTDPNSDYRVAGIYTAQELRELGGTTARFKRGTRIVSMGCSEKHYG